MTPLVVVTGPDPLGHGIQVAVATWSASAAPTREVLRSLHADRAGKRAISLIVAVWDQQLAWLFGPNPEAAAVALPRGQAQRVLQAVLDEPDGLAGRTRYAQATAAVSTSRTAGVGNQGLFATHYLATTAPRHPQWAAARAAAAAILGLRHESLIAALGYTMERSASHALLLKSGDAARAVAVLLEPAEQFDAAAARFDVSPAAWGLRAAARAEVPWLLMLRGSQLRLYPARPGVGVGQKSQADTWFEIDLALVDEEQAALLALVFSATALAPGGSTQLFLEGSAQFAVELGERLRDRVYEQAVPRLAAAVAAKLPTLGLLVDAAGLDVAFRLSLRILFRLLFQAYAEDRGLLPYLRNARYDRNALKTWAADLTEHPDQPFDSSSTAIWDDLAQVWRVIDSGDSAWNVPAYNGGLFGSDPALHPEGALLGNLRLANDTMGPVLAALLVDETDHGGFGAVDFRSLSVREFGTIYEGLLESALSITPIPLAAGTVKDKGKTRDVYVPAQPGDEVLVPAGGVYFHSKSGERKATGTYFTPHIVVEHLLERALEPVLADHLARVQALLESGDEAAAAEAFFDLRVADLAMGSAHFLTAAIDRIDARMRDFLTEHPIPAITNELRSLERAATQALGEDAAAAAQIEPAALLRRQIARRCIYGLDINPMAVELARLAIWISTFVPGLPMSSLDHTLVCANSLTGVGTIDEALKALDPTPGSGQISTLSAAITDELAHAKVLLLDVANTSEATKADVTANAHTAAQARAESERARLLFNAVVATRLGLLTPDHLVDADSLIVKVSKPDVAAAVSAVNPAQFPYLFPEVFLRADSGFDCLVGNPPWDKVRHEPQQFWVIRDPGLHRLTGENRDARIEVLRSTDPIGAAEEQTQQEQRDRLISIFRRGFQLQKSQHYDYAKLFAERNSVLLRASGAMGLVLPQASLVLGGWAPIRQTWLDRHLEVQPLRNTGGWIFPEVDGRMTVVLLAAAAGDGATVRAACGSRDAFLNPLGTALVDLDRAAILSLSEEACLPWFEHPDSPQLFRTLSQRPTLGSGRGWAAGSADSTRWDFSGSGPHKAFVSTRPSAGAWRVTMTRHVDAYELTDDAAGRWIPDPLALIPLGKGVVRGPDRQAELDSSHPPLVFRFPTNNDNSRTLIASALPTRGWLYSKGYAHGIRVPEGTPPSSVLALLAHLNSLVADWWARRFVDRHVGKRIIEGMPLPEWGVTEIAKAAELAAELSRRGGITTLGGLGPIPAPESGLGHLSKFELLAGIDGLVMAGFGLSAGDLEVILDDFTEKPDAVPPDYRSRLRAAVIGHE